MIKNVKTGQEGFWVDVQPDGNGVEEPGRFRLCITSGSDFYCFRMLDSRALTQLIETVAVAVGYQPGFRVRIEVPPVPPRPPRKTTPRVRKFK